MPPASVPWMVVSNRGLALFAIWITAALVVYIKQAEVRTPMARHQAEIANRATSELLANMSHELHTPLNTIIGFAKTIKQQTFGLLGHEKYVYPVDDIHASGCHLLEVINDILDISAIEDGELYLREKNLDMIDVIGALLRQGGTPVEARLGVCGPFNIPIADLVISMTKEKTSKATTMLDQGEEALFRARVGTGLGLPPTKQLVELHGGLLNIESTKGIGTAGDRAPSQGPRQRRVAPPITFSHGWHRGG